MPGCNWGFLLVFTLDFLLLTVVPPPSTTMNKWLDLGWNPILNPLKSTTQNVWESLYATTAFDVELFGTNNRWVFLNLFGQKLLSLQIINWKKATLILLGQRSVWLFPFRPDIEFLQLLELFLAPGCNTLVWAWARTKEGSPCHFPAHVYVFWKLPWILFRPRN